MKLFVFGTLMSGYSANNLLGDKAYKVCDAFLCHHDMYAHSFPALNRNEKAQHKILGEIWEVMEEDIPRVDRYEGHPNLFKREQLAVVDIWPIDVKIDLEDLDVWMYEFQWGGRVDFGTKILPDENGVVSFRNVK